MLPAAAPRGSAQPDSCRTDYQLNTIPSSPNNCDSGRANMPFHTKTLQNAAKPHVTQYSPRAAPEGLRVARPLAHAPSPPQRASPRRLATSPSSRLDPQPPRHRRRRLSCAPRGHQVRPALPVPRGHRRRAAPDSNMIEDELRQLGLVARRRSASSWLDCSNEGGGTTRGELGVCARR